MTQTDRRVKRLRNNTLALVTSLALVAIYVVTLGLNPEPEQSQPYSYSSQTGAEKIANGLVIERYDEQGHLSNKLSSNLAEFYSNLQREGIHEQTAFEEEMDEAIYPEDATEDTINYNSTFLDFTAASTTENEVVKLQSPIIKFYRAQTNHTEINANYAYLMPEERLVDFEGGVRLIDSINDSLLLTETLSVDIAQKQLLTRDSVQLLDPISSTSAVGLQGNLTEQRWQLLSNVKSAIVIED